MSSKHPGRLPASGSRARSVESRRRYAVIMAGGIGSRFWPWSRESLPKQLLPMAGPRSMLAETALRLRGLVPEENVFVVTAERLRTRVRGELAGMAAERVLAEPVGRNTAPCIGWATLEILARDPDAVTLVLPADHVVRPASAFRRDARKAFALADRERSLVTFGVPPTEPSSAYGYIRVGRKRSDGAFPVRAFVEKPSVGKARRYLASREYYWNSGMFAWRADVVWDELERHLPPVAAALRPLAGSKRRKRRASRAAVVAAFDRVPSISIDYGLLERSDNVTMVEASFSWSDIGSWDAVAALWPKDRRGNAARARLVSVDANDNLAASSGKTIALVGVSGLVVVETEDALLVCPRERCQDVRAVVDELRRIGRRDLL